jgi:uncharacterized protein (DUF305 family)
MNYKISTIILAVLLIICGIWHITSMRHHGGVMNHDMSGEPNMNHSMSDGSGMNHDMSMDSMMSSMAARMEAADSESVDKIFLVDMIAHHQGAVEMAEILAEKTARPELQKMAADIISVQTKEIDMMQTWLKAWFAQ